MRRTIKQKNGKKNERNGNAKTKTRNNSSPRRQNLLRESKFPGVHGFKLWGRTLVLGNEKLLIFDFYGMKMDGERKRIIKVRGDGVGDHKERGGASESCLLFFERFVKRQTREVCTAISQFTY